MADGQSDSSQIPLYLFKHRRSSKQRHHFAIFIPYTKYAIVEPIAGGEACFGTRIHVVGLPMHGFTHQIDRNYDVQTKSASVDPLVGQVHIGSIDGRLVNSTVLESNDAQATNRSQILRIAEQIAPPRKSEDFNAPVNDTTNRRCQEWTMEFIEELVRVQILSRNAVDVAQQERDAPNFGIGLTPIDRKQVM